MQILANYSYHRPSTLQAAWDLMNDNYVIMAGGSDVMPQLKMATLDPELMIDLSKIEEIKKVSEEADGIHIGSMMTLSHLAKDPLILEKLPIISQAARNVASPQIRNRGTIGGNVLQARRCFYFNQTKGWRAGIPRCYKVGGDVCIQIANSPVCRAIYYSDMAPALLALNTKVNAMTEEGMKIMELEELLMLHCGDRLPKILIKEFIIPKENLNASAMRFCKYSLRGSIDFPVINFACLVNGSDVRFTAGAIACNVLRLTDVENYISAEGADFDPAKASDLAVAEMKEKSQIIREAGLSVNVKRASFLQVHEILEDIKKQLKKSL